MSGLSEHRLERRPALEAVSLLAPATARALAALPEEDASRVDVAPIDPGLADTEAFCAAYGISPAASANCLVVAGRRGEDLRYAACVVLATTRADINHVVRRLLDAKRASFAPMDDAVAATGMEYGGITPIGIPATWRLLIDSRVREVPDAVIGAGIRAAKLFLPGELLCSLPAAEVIDGLAQPVLVP